MSGLPYEEPTAGPSTEAPMPGDEEDGYDLGPAPGLADDTRPSMPPPVAPSQDMSVETARLLQALATHEREEFERVMTRMVENTVNGLHAKFDSIILDPQAVLRNGIIFGAAGVVIALVLLLVIGLLFLYGLSLVNAAR